MTRYWSAALILFCGCVFQFALGQSIRVRVVSADTGKPLSGKEVDVEAVKQPALAHHDLTQTLEGRPRLKLTTTPEGWASFQLRELGSPSPERLLVSVAVGNWTQCSPQYVSVEEIIHSGVVLRNYCVSEAAKNQTYTANSAELVVFTRHISLGEKLKRFPQ